MALVTAGDLLFWGDLNRSTITYAVNGRQYVAVMTGDGQSATANPLRLARTRTVRGHNEIYVFALPERR